jgi:periplasmic protein CpxP/Spy
MSQERYLLWNRRRHSIRPLARVMMAAFLSTPLMLSSLAAADAQTKPAPAANNPANANPIEQRINQLHTELKITPDQESKWAPVAQAIRDNQASMEKAIGAKQQQVGQNQNMTAVDDLETSLQFAQVHLDGLKSLTSAFKPLYASMSDEQKKNADEVFAKMGRPAPTNTPNHS